jgi:hypothetical protein
VLRACVRACARVCGLALLLPVVLGLRVLQVQLTVETRGSLVRSRAGSSSVAKITVLCVGGEGSMPMC